MEDRETPRVRKYGESKTTRIMMATVPHVTAWAGRTNYQADGFLFDWVYRGMWLVCQHHTGRFHYCHPWAFTDADQRVRSTFNDRLRNPIEI